MTKWQQFKKWWLQNIIRHGEPENISEITGLSESDMSRKLTPEEYKRFTDSLSKFWKKFFNTNTDAIAAVKDKNNVPAYKTMGKTMLAVLAAYFGFTNFFNRTNKTSASDPNFEADSEAIDLLKSIGAVTDSNDSQSYRGINDLFKNLFSTESGSLLSGLVGIGSEFGNSWLNMKNMQQLIDYQNAYNTPKAQMERFQEAGLNPNLIYGLGSNGNQPASGSIAPVDFDTAQRENRLAKMQIMTQTKQAEADIAQKMAYTKLLDTQQRGAELENDYNAQTMNDRIFMVTKQVDQLCNSVELQIKEINNWDDFRQAQMTLMEAQTYAGFLSGHSIFGKVSLELKELGKKLAQKAKEKFPHASKEFSDMWSGFLEDFDRIYE